MATRILITFPAGDVPGLRAEAAQLALGLTACGHEVLAMGPLGAWRHPLRTAGVLATEFALPGEERRLTQAVQEAEPQIIHAFGADAAHLVLPLTQLIGAGGVATLGHGDLTRLIPAQFRTASAIFVPCDYLREQLMRRLPTVPVITTGYTLPPVEEPDPGQLRFLAQELGLEDGAPVVLLADRFVGGETDVALALIEAIPQLAAHIPGVQVVIAGSGLRLGELEGQAIAINNRLGRRAVLLPGHRDDMPQLLALATVAVGSGRFAAEAIGAGVALVAAGAAGMIGTFTEEVAQVAHFSCGGKHGHFPAVTPRTLASEIVGLFAYPDYRASFAAAGQAALLTLAERTAQATHLMTYYARTAPTGVITRPPQRITAMLPEDLRALLFTLPALAGLRTQFPLARLRLVTTVEHQRLLEATGLAERVLAYPGEWTGWPGFLRDLCHPRPDVCLVCTSDLGSTVLAGTTLAPHRLGYADGAGSLLLSDHLHTRMPTSPARAQVLTQALGVSASAAVPAPAIPDALTQAVDHSLLAAGVEPHEPLVVLCPPADATLAWPAAQWTQLARLLTETRPERVAVLGQAEVTLPDGVIPIAPAQDSLLLAALLARATVVVAADSSVLHLAALLGTPTVGLYGPTSPDTCALPGTGMVPVCARERACHPCGDEPCAERPCLLELTPAAVADALAELLPSSPVMGLA